MNDADQLDEILQQHHAAEPARADRQAGSDLRLDPDSGSGELGVTVEGDRDPTWDDELRFVGVNPDEFEVYGPYIEVRSWDAPVGNGKVKRLRYVKARIRSRTDAAVDRETVVDVLRKAKPSRRRQPLDVDRADVVCLSDWQIGKAGEAGGGTAETVGRVVDMIGMAQDRADDLRKVGRRAGTLVLAGMGDNVERCFGHYAGQKFVVDLNEREQRRVARSLLAKVVAELAPRYDRVVTAAVASNHGENREGGKAATDPSDSLDLELWENLAVYVDGAGDRLSHVEVVAPTDPLVLSLEVAGQGVAFIHGHQATRGGGTAAAKLWEWWRGQSHGDNPQQLASGHTIGSLPAGRCRVLVGAHYHHHYVVQQQGRTLLGCPALDGGSRWFTDSSGVWSSPGTLAFSLVSGRHAPCDVGVLG